MAILNPNCEIIKKYSRTIVKFLGTKDAFNKNGNTALGCGHYCTTFGLRLGGKIYCHDCAKKNMEHPFMKTEK